LGVTLNALDPAINPSLPYQSLNQVLVIPKEVAAAWSAPVRISGTYPDNSPRKALGPNLAVDAQGRVHVVWHENTAPQGDASIYYVFYRIFQGGAWQPTEQVSTSTSPNSIDPDVAVASDGRAFVVFTSPAARVSFRERAANGGWSGVVALDSIRSGGASVTVDASDNPHVTWIEDTSNGDGGNNWDAVYRARIAGVWGTIKVFSNPDGTDIEPKLAIKPDGSMTIMWCDYNDIYIARNTGGVWGATVRLANDVGAASLSLIYDPISGAIHMLAAARKLGYTYSDSWDVLYYSE
jgi:hypothetical protein